MEPEAGPRWLDDQELSAWLELTAMLSWLPDALDAQLQRDAGLSHFEYQVMAMLSMSPGRTRRMKEVAALANGSLTRLSRTVDRLEARGWVTRRPDPEDGRSTLAVLTDAGWDKIVDTAPGHVAEVRRLVFDPLTRGQVGQLHEIARRVRRVVHPEGLLPSLSGTDAP
ncbi:MAG TPA: MarR family winged helix-turn-helix transcriptional regulator [Aquihabitans sp.]|nr:MarR family winged helix-turn-helix transcriptional regulator [Aquihabitans sp.]